MFYQQNNFNKGVVSAWLDTRGDLNFYRNALRVCENFMCMPYGGLRRRMGFEFVSQSKGKSRLIGYQRSSKEGYILELGQNYLRVHKNGRRVAGLELATPWNAQEVFELQFVKLNNVLFFTHQNHPPQELRYSSENSWSILPVDFDHPAFRDYKLNGSKISVTPDTTATSTETITFNTSATTTRVASGSVPVRGSWEVDIASLSFTPAVDPDPAPTSYLKLQKSADNGTTWEDVHSFSAVDTYTGVIAGGILRLVALEVNAVVTLISSNDVEALAVGDSVIVQSTGSDFTQEHVGSEILVSHTPDVTEKRLSLASSGVSEWITVQGGWNLFTSGTWRGKVILESSKDNGTTVQQVILRQGDADRNISENGDVSDKILMRVRYKKTGSTSNSAHATLETDGSDIQGRVLLTGVINSSQAVGTVRAGVYSSDATEFWKEAAWSNYSGYPAAVTWHEGRLWFGGTKKDPATLWASATDDFFNFESGTKDDSGFSRTMGTTELTDIVWLASQSGLYIGTSGEEWRGRSFSDSGVITPSSFVLRRVSNSGSEPVSPIFAGAHLIHVQRQGRSLIQIGYNAASASEDGYSPSDLNELAPHVSFGGITTIAYQTIRDSIIWGTTGAGKLIGLSFNTAQKVYGWHEHVTSGGINSVATVYEQGYEDSVYISVNRNGVYMIERMRVDQYDIIENQDKSHGLYVDSAIELVGENLTKVTGLEHLEGRIVQCVGDGSFMGESLVKDGEITLSSPVSRCTVGLEYTSLMETLPLFFDAGDGSSTGRYKRANFVSVRTYRSQTCEAAVSGTGAHRWENMRQSWRQNNDLGLEEKEGELGYLEDWDIPLASGHDTDARVAIRTNKPVGLNILSVTTNTTFTG